MIDSRGAYEIGKSALANGANGAAGNRGVADVSSSALKRQQAAQEFASLLFLEVLKAMRAALPQDGLFEGDSLSRDVYTSMMDAEIAKVMARRDASGFARNVERSLEKLELRPAEDTVVTPAAVAPVEGRVSSVYGLRNDPFGGPAKLHNGIDIAAPAGTPVRAVSAGRVVFSGHRPGYGNIVELAHNDGLLTRYAHNSRNLVQEGQVVAAGQTLGLVGSSGRATAPHLHFEVLRAGRPVDPAALYAQAVKGTKISSSA